MSIGTTSGREFKLYCGRTVILESLKQWVVYAGLLEGLPTRQSNDAELQRLVEEARHRDGHDPVLITPAQLPIPYDGQYRFGEPVRLPSIACIGRFFSHDPAREPSKDCSDLCVIWFQDDFAFPLSAAAEDAILAIDWNQRARDREY